MQLSPAEMAHRIYKQVIPDDFFEFKCSNHMLKIMVCLDGASNLVAVSQKAGLTMKETIEAISHLSSLNIIEAAPNTETYLKADFFIVLKKQLSTALGPVAEILIEDAVGDLGHAFDTFPAIMSAELVELLAKDIQREDKRIIFQQNMIAFINSGGAQEE
jgi:hypothetical protein